MDANINISLTLEASLYATAYGSVALEHPAPALFSTGYTIRGSARMMLPHPALDAYSGGVVFLQMPAPMFESDGTLPGFALVVLEHPTPELTATGLTGTLGVVALEQPAPTLAANGGGYAELEASSPVLVATGEVWGLGYAVIENPAPGLAATGTVFGLGRVALEMPVPLIDAGNGNSVTLVVPVPSLFATGYGAADAAATTTYAVNLETGAITQVLWAAHAKLVTARGKLYGLRGTTLYELAGDTDDGDPIPATIRFAQQNWGTNAVKRVTEVYLTSREDDGVTLEIVRDEQTKWRYQTDPGAGQRYGAHKVSVGRGVTFHTAGLMLRNRDGGALTVGGIEMLTETLSRRKP